MSSRDGDGSGPGGLALKQSTLLPSVPFLSFQLLMTQPSPRETICSPVWPCLCMLKSYLVVKGAHIHAHMNLQTSTTTYNTYVPMHT